MARRIVFEINDAQRVINTLRGREYSDPTMRDVQDPTEPSLYVCRIRVVESITVHPVIPPYESNFKNFAFYYNAAMTIVSLYR